jgi:MFS transporter, DHA1 family, multidrug resistance protein
MNTQTRSITILFFTMIVVMLGFGIIIPLMPFYVESFGAGGLALGALMAEFGLLQFFFSPFWGSLSDRVGRKKILSLGIFGNAIAMLFFGLSTELWMLFAARALAGILSSATIPTAQAYISDTTSEQDRSRGMGILGAAFGIGMVLGPGIGGLLSKGALSTPFFLASALSIVALLLVLFFLPEPAHHKASQKSKVSGLNFPLLRQALTGPLGILFFMSFLLTFGLTNFEAVFGLYSAQKYDYNAQQVGLILSVVGLVSAIMQGVITGPATRRLGEVRIIRLSLLGTAIGFILMLLPRSMFGVLLSAGFFAFSNAMLFPSVNSLISRRTTDGQGTSMGLSTSFQSLGRVFGPLWAGFAFDIYLFMPYLTGAIIMLAGFAISLTRLSDAPAVAEIETQAAQD